MKNKKTTINLLSVGFVQSGEQVKLQRMEPSSLSIPDNKEVNCDPFQKGLGNANKRREAQRKSQRVSHCTKW